MEAGEQHAVWLMWLSAEPIQSEDEAISATPYWICTKQTPPATRYNLCQHVEGSALNDQCVPYIHSAVALPLLDDELCRWRWTSKARQWFSVWAWAPHVFGLASQKQEKVYVVSQFGIKPKGLVLANIAHTHDIDNAMFCLRCNNSFILKSELIICLWLQPVQC